MLSLLIQLTPPVGAANATIPAGTKVIVKLQETVSSATNKKGDAISMVAAADVMINGERVIASGAPAVGTVLDASKRFIAGIGGQLDIQVDKVQAVDGSWIPLEYKSGAHNGSNLMSVICTVVCCIVFIFIPGKDVSIEKGTIYETTVTSPANVHTATR